MKKKIEAWILPLSMLLGVVGEAWFRALTPVLPPLIFLMLFFTFCKVNPLDLRLRLWHLIVLVLQMALAFLTYALLYRILPEPYREPVAQGCMMCLIMPTATAAPIIAGKLGGSIQNLTAFTLLSNLATVIIVPLYFPVIYPMVGMDFSQASLIILRKVGPLLMGPFLAAWALRLCWDMYQRKREQKPFVLPPYLASMPFYIWSGTLVILMASLTHTMIEKWDGWAFVLQAVGAILACAVQFYLGKMIGYRWPASSHGKDYQDVVINPLTAPKDKAGISRITAGQAFGQKNTTLGVWMAQTFLNPMSAIGPALYIIWQNLYNSWQLKRAAGKTA